MNRKNLPLFLMLTAGAVTSIITYIEKYPMVVKLVSLFVVLLIFYVLGCMIKWTLDFFELQNGEKRKEEGEDIEEEPVEPEDSEDAAENPEDEPEN